MPKTTKNTSIKTKIRLYEVTKYYWQTKQCAKNTQMLTTQS